MLVTNYLQRAYKKGNTDQVDLGKHLVDFLELYGTLFNYEDIGISIRKNGFYFKKSTRGWESWGDERQRLRLCVENPQDREIDIGKSAYNIRKVQRAF